MAVMVIIMVFVAVASWIVYLLIQSFVLSKRARAPRQQSTATRADSAEAATSSPVAVVQVVAKLEASMMGQWELCVSHKAYETNVQALATYLGGDAGAAAVVIIAGDSFMVVQRLLGGNANGDDVYVLALSDSAATTTPTRMALTDYSTMHVMVFPSSSNAIT